jgi:hypothetical protein
MSSNGVAKIFNKNEIRKISKELPIFAPNLGILNFEI